MNISVNNMETKICLKCKDEKGLDEFASYIQGGKYNYHFGDCKICRNLTNKIHSNFLKSDNF